MPPGFCGWNLSMTDLLHSKYRSTASRECHLAWFLAHQVCWPPPFHHLKTQESLVAEVIRRDLYVDNLITGAASSSSAVSFYKKTKALFAIASMNIQCSVHAQAPEIGRNRGAAARPKPQTSCFRANGGRRRWHRAPFRCRVGFLGTMRPFS